MLCYSIYKFPRKAAESHETADRGDSGEALKGAEGARRMPNLSGKRTERILIFSFLLFGVAFLQGSFFIFNQEKKT